MDVKAQDPIEFNRLVQEFVKAKNVDYLDAVLHVCEKTGIEPETAAVLIEKLPNLKSEIRDVGERQNLIPRISKLPI